MRGGQVAVAGLILVLAAMIAIAASPRLLPLTYTLHRAEAMTDTGEDEAIASYALRQGQPAAATLTARLETLDVDLHLLQVSLWHTPDTQLDRLTLRVDTGLRGPAVAWQAPLGLADAPLTYGLTRDGRGALLDIPRLDAAGEGTLTFEFLLRGELSTPVLVGAAMALHRRTLFPLRQGRAQTTLQLQP